MFSPKTRHDISRIIPISLIWLMFSVVYTLLERGILGELSSYPATGNPYDFTKSMLSTPLSAWITGLIIGTVEVRYLNKLFIKRTFTQKIYGRSLSTLPLSYSFCSLWRSLPMPYNWKRLWLTVRFGQMPGCSFQVSHSGAW
ncbi:MAG: hypothetical protein WDN75_09015 [Bacteroidota bacterium]